MIWAVSLSTPKLISRSPTARRKRTAFRVWLGSVSAKPPSPSSALPPCAPFRTLALKLFRGEQAISEFGWHITPTHSSSPHFAI